MSALTAIEAPVAAAENRAAARSNGSANERPLRVVDASTPAFAIRPARGSASATGPRSSSIPRTGGQESPSQASPILTGPSVAGPSLTGPSRTSPSPILTGTVVSGRRLHFAPASSVEVSRPPLRLTRRGRIVVAVLLVAVLSVAILLVTGLVSGRAQATNHGQPRAGYQGMHQVVVRPGQTLWSIAVAAEPTADPRNVVQQIMTANALSSPGIAAGQLLWVP